MRYRLHPVAPAIERMTRSDASAMMATLGTTGETATLRLQEAEATLARIDTVAYVRFASVYKNFQAADDFEDFVQELRPPQPDNE